MRPTLPQMTGKIAQIGSNLCGFGTGATNLLTMLLIGRAGVLAHSTWTIAEILL
jgi:hypothetical protein